MNLQDALAQAGILTAMEVPGWLGRLLSLVETEPGLVPEPSSGRLEASVALALDPALARVLGGTARVQATGDATTAAITVPLSDLVLQWEGGSAAGATAESSLTVTVTRTGAVSCTVAGDGRLTVSGAPPALEGPGLTRVELDLDEVAVTADAGAPSLVLGGTLTVSVVPGVEPTARFRLQWGVSGLAGTASGTVGQTTYAVSWGGHQDWCPASLNFDLPVPDVVGHGVHPQGRLRLTGGRDATGELTLAAEVMAPDEGIVASGESTVVTAATLLAACAGSVGGPATPAEVGAVVAAAGLLAEALDGHGRVRVTRARLDLAQPDRAELDYVTELGCDADAGALRIRTTAPMRASVRGVAVDWSGPPRLDWRTATIEVSDPGQWQVERPAGLLQVDKVRSGQGSTWFELDLRFAIALGPVEVDTATVRVQLDGGALGISLRGFGARISVPGLVSGAGSVSFSGSSVFHAALRADLVPLNLRAAAALTLDQSAGYPALLAQLDVDLPAPVPLASTGLGLFGVGGLLGVNHQANFGGDFEQRLRWTPEANMSPRRGSTTLGLKVAIGTLPDLGHGFAAVGRLAVSTPDLAIVAAVAARVLGGRPSVIEPTDQHGPRLRGVLALIPSQEIYLAVQASYEFPESTSWRLVQLEAPLEARWTVAQPEAWYVHLGTDRSRPPGPIRAVILPDLLPGAVRGEAFLMIHGDGIAGLPVATARRGLVVAAGIDVSTTLYALPAVADIYARAVVALSTRPVFLAGRAQVGGSLRLGPFRLGIDAGLDLQIGPGSTYAATVRICGEIDLWLFEISGCVSFSLGNRQEPELEPPESPVASIVPADHRGATVRPASDGLPVVWPDGTVQIGFATAPRTPAQPPGRFRVNPAPFVPSGDNGDPSSYLVHYDLTGLDLRVVDEAGHPTGPALPAALPATWQTKPGQPPVPGDGSAVMSLLTHDGALWTGHLVDGGTSDRSDPVGARRRECISGQVFAREGWAWGAEARPTGASRWMLPPHLETSSPGGLDSRVRVSDVRTTWPSVVEPHARPAGPGSRAWLPVGLVGRPGGVVAEPVQLWTLDLPGWLQLPDVLGDRDLEEPPETRWRFTARTTLVFAETVTDALLVLLTDEEPPVDMVSTRGDAWQQTHLDPGRAGACSRRGSDPIR